MEDWRIRPIEIEYWDESVDSVLAIDENGTVDLNGIRKNLESHINGELNDDRWFTISGISLNKMEYTRFIDYMNSIKYTYWQEGCYSYKQGNKRVVFHSREIRKRVGPFNPKFIDYSNFMVDISGVIQNTDFTIYSSSIDKVKHILKYSTPYPVYNLCMEFILERYSKHLNSNGQRGILLLEARGKKEDASVLAYLVDLLEKGNRYNTPSDFQNICGVYFNPKWSKNHKDKLSYPILELADLISYPIHKYVKIGERDKAFQAIESKINNFPVIEGFGLKIFP